MGTFELTDLGAIGAIGIVVVAFALVGFAKGMVRMLFGLISLAAAVLAASWGFQRGASVASYVVTDPDPWMAGAVGIIMGLAIFFAARAIFGVLVKPTRIVDGKKKNLAGPGGVLGLFAGVVFVWFLISGVRYVGSLAEMRRLRDSLAGDAVVKTAEPLVVKIKNIVDGSVPGRLHERFDFLNDKARCTLAKLQILVQNPAAIKQATRDPAVRKTFGQPDIRQLLETSPELNVYVKDGQFSQLLESDKLRQVAAKPAANEILRGADIEIALGFTLPEGDSVAAAKE